LFENHGNAPVLIGIVGFLVMSIVITINKASAMPNYKNNILYCFLKNCLNDFKTSAFQYVSQQNKMKQLNVSMKHLI
jgi:hypothetical protein